MTEPKDPTTGTYPVLLVLRFSDGTEQTLPFNPPKPSSVSGKTNCHAGGKVANTWGDVFQVGCNATQLQPKGAVRRLEDAERNLEG